MYDVIIIGGGPSGLACGVYCGRAGLKTLILEKMYSGGQMATTPEIANYPGIAIIDGMELSVNMENHAKECGAEVIVDEVNSLELDGKIKKVIAANGTYEAKVIILSMGAKRRKLNIEGEEEFAGRGISYCATCDGGFYRNKVTAVIGGGNTALEDCEYLSRFCEKVYLIHRRDEFRGVRALVKNVIDNTKIEIIYNTIPVKISGEKSVTNLLLKDTKTNKEKTIEVDGIFVAVGTEPTTDLVKGMIDLDSAGYIIANEDCKTNIDGVFAIGDIRAKPLRQIVTAVSDGAVASMMAGVYIGGKGE